MYEYPYGNSQQLNLDWILNKVKEFENSGASSADMKSIANALLSASYDAGSAYAVNDVVYNDTLETLYICNTAIPVGGEPWDATHWDAFRVGEVLTFLFNTIQNLPSDNIANNSNVTGTGLTTALNALVEDIKYSNHYLQQKKNGVYTDVIPIEDTPSNNSDRLASSKAAYDLKGAIDAITPLDTTPTSGSTKGITSGAVYTTEHTISTINPSRGSAVIDGTNLGLNECRKFLRVVTYRAMLESKTSSEVTYPHDTVLFTGLPKPVSSVIFMADTFTTDKSNQHQYRVRLNTDGEIRAYWDTVHIPPLGQAFLVDVTYLTAE